VSSSNCTAIRPQGYRGKRTLDLIMVSLVGVVTFPLVLVIWFLVRAIMGAPAFFRQKRPGFRGQVFEIVKFRTMTEARDQDGHTLPDGSRLTPLGRFLRKMSLDELPEIWNVFRGEMSVVGPRPLLVEYQPYYTSRERRRFDVRPGLTGLAQVSGRNTLNWDQRLELDAAYVESASFWLDLKILVKTIKVVLFGDGVAVDTDEVETRLDEERGAES